MVGWEIKLPAAYTGEFSFTKVVHDTANETDQVYETDNNYTNITQDSVADDVSPIMYGRKGDSILFETTAVPGAGTAYVTLFFASGPTKEAKRY